MLVLTLSTLPDSARYAPGRIFTAGFSTTCANCAGDITSGTEVRKTPGGGHECYGCVWQQLVDLAKTVSAR